MSQPGLATASWPRFTAYSASEGVLAEPSQDGQECLGLAVLEGVGVWAVDNDELVLDVEWFGSSAAVACDR